jgi:hypothetical protein
LLFEDLLYFWKRLLGERRSMLIEEILLGEMA